MLLLHSIQLLSTVSSHHTTPRHATISHILNRGDVVYRGLGGSYLFRGRQEGDETRQGLA